MKTPNRKEPPIIQCEDQWDEKTRTLSYSYNGRALISLKISGKDEPSYRRDSDGTLNSIPLVQQIYVMTKKDVTAEVTFRLSSDALNMRPKRATHEKAIIGQVGKPLVYGINGIYDINEDYLISWYGKEWEWLQDRFEVDAKTGELTAKMKVELGRAALFINFFPQYYRRHLGYKYHEPWKVRPETKPISGWCSWEAARRNVSQKLIDEVADLCAKEFKPYGLEFVQLDDGYELLPLPHDPSKPLDKAWTETDPAKFPAGHEGIVKSISKTGLTPGIWTSCSIYNDDFPKYQSDCIIKDEKGEPILGDWIKYLIDCRPPTLKKHVEPTYKGLADKGYKYFKTDVTRHLLFDGFHKAVAQGLMTNDESEQKHRAYLECARKAIGYDNFWLLSWGVMTEGAGVVDACRISMDALPTWSGLRMQMVESARWWHCQRILWQNDPDHVCVRAKKDWVKSVLSTVSLSGGLFMLSDALENYNDPERIYMIQRCLPPLPTYAGETGPLDVDYTAFTWTKFHGFGVLNDPPYKSEDMGDAEARDMAGWSESMADKHPFGCLWAFHLDTPVDRWCVIQRNALLPLEASQISVESLGLEKGREYIAFDFWSQKYLGVFKDKLKCKALALGHCQTIAIRLKKDVPQFISSTRHVSQDAISVKMQTWKDKTLTLKLQGVAGSTETYWIRVPKGMKPGTVDGAGISAEALKPSGDVLPIRVKFNKADSELKVRF